MKKLTLYSLIVIIILPSVILAQGTDVPAGDVSGTWTKANSPYRIHGDIVVPLGQSLTIESGVKVQFQGYFMLNIKGNVCATGTPGDTILFTVADTAGFSNIESETGSWKGVKIENLDWSMWDSDSSVFTYCKFEYGKSIEAGNEWADIGGGAMVIRNFSRVLIRHCVFRVNHSASNGGALFIGNDCSPEIDRCAFIENETASGGGAITLKYNSNPFIHNCLFYKNTSFFVGGAIWSHFGKGKILNNTFSNNTAYNSGGALHLNSSNEKIIGNLIVNNDAHQVGGGVSNNESWPEFYNNHVCNNNAGLGGGINFWSMTNADLYNNIFWGNTEDWSGAKNPSQIDIGSSNATPNFYNCIIQDGISGISDYHGIAENIIESQPQFINQSANTGTDADGLDADWTLSTTSPAINNGSNAIKDELLVEIDLMGRSRIIHGIIDIGALESRIDSITVADTISENTWWIADTVRVTGDIIIKDSITLNIAPGTCVEFQGYYSIQVFGTIKACGSNKYPIIFTVNDTSGFSDRSSLSGSWNGIIFDNSQWLANGVMSDNDSSILRYCVIQYAKYFPSDWNSIQGGAVKVRYFSNLEISNCTLQYNISKDGGALGIDMYSHPLISGNLIYRNVATSRGGGILIANKSKPIIVNNYIFNNAALDNVTFSKSGGGGIMVYAASPFIIDNVICNNYADFAAGICIGSSKPFLAGNTVCNNLVSEDSPGLCEWDSKFNMYNSIFWGNTSPDGWWSTKQMGISNPQNFYHNNIEGGLDGINMPWDIPSGDFAGNINADPVFANPTQGPGIEYDALQADWSITDYSPNINKGFPENGQLNLPDKDIAGKNRIRYEIIDIGAFENQGEPLHISKQPFNQIACQGDTIEFAVGVEGNARFQWLKDGEVIPGPDTNKIILDSVTMNDMADYICKMSNGYGMLLSNNVTLVVNSPPEILLQTESQWVKEDNNLKLEIHARGTEPVFYEWMKNGVVIPGTNLPEFRINKMSYQNEGTYICQASNQCGEIQSVPITLFVAPQICMVTVDMETGNNLVIWEKRGTAPVTWYMIYRESIVAGEYDLIGKLHKDSLSVFLDTVADPSKQAYIYKITAIDDEGFESSIDLCKPHKTIHLITSINMTTGDSQLEWDQYYGFIYGTYYIYRSLTESNFSIIHSMSSSTSAYTDPNPDNLLYYYRISVERPEDCAPTVVGKKAGTGPYSHSMSNIEDNRLQATGLIEEMKIQDLTIFPNPFNNRTTIRFPNPEATLYTLQIIDLTGKVVRTHEITGQSEFTLEREGLESGYYLIELRGEKLYRGKIIIE
ncbi:MAG: hypothetical protein AMS27_04790 [Bacteroides sp. SM23_62_1]|nr:MAG: hypothetical protein AMS27_04790 [Bacteroides sp. SM23_62_1]